MTARIWAVAFVAAGMLGACSPTMSEQDADNLENEIRTTYEARGAEVVDLDIEVIDDRRLGGSVRLRDPSTGEEVTNECSAELPEGGSEFEWTCI